MTSAYVGLFALDAVFLVVGGAVVWALGLAVEGRRNLRLAGLAFFLGWSASALLMSVALSFGIDVGVGELAGQSLLLIGACIVSRRVLPPLGARRAPAPGSGIPRIVALAGGALICFSLGAALFVASRYGADSTWDAWAFWLPKAKAIYYFHGLDTGLGGFTTYRNPGYPPAVPAMAATAFHLMGGPHAMLLPLQQTLLGVAFIASAAVLLVRHVPAWLVLSVLALLALSPEFWDRLTTVLPDQTIGYLISIAAVAVVLFFEEGATGWLVMAVLVLGAAAQTKDEGFTFGLALAIAATAAALVFRREWRPFLLCLGPATIVPWLLWLSRHHLSLSSGQYSWTNLARPDYLADRFDRLTYALRGVGNFLFTTSDWRFLAPLALVSAVAAVRTRPEAAGMLLLWLLFAFGSLVAVYWIGVLDIHYWIVTSAKRVVATLPIVAGTLTPFLLAAALRPRARRSVTISGDVPAAKGR